MANINLVINGASGRMGQAVARLAHQNRLFNLIGGIDIVNFSSLEWCGCKIFNASKDADGILSKADVVIDFSTPKSVLWIAGKCVNSKTVLITGTTGLNNDQMALLKNATSKDLTCVQAANFGVGTNLLLKLVAKAASVLDGHDWDVEIFEAHHNLKQDAPSGTAKKLGEAIAGARYVSLSNVARHDRCGVIGARPHHEIGFQVMRGGDITGEHTVYFCGRGERLELIHRAHNRNLFATGALLAAKWAVNIKRPGMYSFADDVLNLRDF